MGAQSVIMSAKILTAQPASAAEIPKCICKIGMSPIAPSSVLRIEKTPKVRINIKIALELDSVFIAFFLLYCLESNLKF